MSRQYFFATGADLQLVLWHLEEKFDIMYVEEGRLTGTTPRTWKMGSDLPHFGVATGDQEIVCDPYLITRLHAEPYVQSSLMSDGQLRYDVFPRANPESMLLRRGGRWKDGSLISGHFIASSNAEFSRQLTNSIRYALRKHFTKVEAYWVGPEALLLLRTGIRLCSAIQSPPEYDLREMQ